MFFCFRRDCNMQRIMGIAIICFTLIGSTAGQPIATSANVNQIVTGLNAFAFELYHKVSDPNQNMIISPYSLSSLLSLLVSGAALNTNEELIRLLHFENAPHPKLINAVLNKLNISLHITNQCGGWLSCHLNKLFKGFNQEDDTQSFTMANALWADKKFAYRPAFLTDMHANHAVNFYTLDFTNQPEKSRIKINDWIESNTNGYIQQLLPAGSITTATRLILTNAIYFKGLWQLPFKPEYTGPKAFILTDNQSVQVPMMHQQDQFLYTENANLQLLQLSYAHSTLALAILLPKENHSLQEIVQKLNFSTFLSLIQTLHHQEVIVSLPRFKIESRLSTLSEAIQSLGLHDAFNDKADFSRMTYSTLFISDIIQKALIEVDEKGTVAAAATVAIMTATAIGSAPAPVTFNAHHPFLFIIYDTHSNLILFMGQVINPS